MALSKFQFIRPMLMGVSFERNLDADFKENVVPAIHLQRYFGKHESNSAIVELTLQLNKKDDEVDKTAPYWLEVKYGAVFEWEAGTDKQEVASYLEINAPAMLLSYIRPVVAQLTAASPYGVYHVPLINMVEVYGKKDHE